jgi:chromosome segregation and condensation protein ScpB
MSIYTFKKVNGKSYTFILTDKYLGLIKIPSLRLWKRINEINLKESK